MTMLPNSFPFVVLADIIIIVVGSFYLLYRFVVRGNENEIKILEKKKETGRI